MRVNVDTAVRYLALSYEILRAEGLARLVGRVHRKLRPRRPDDPKDLKSPLARPDVAFAHPNFTAVTDEALYVNDRANYRIVRARLGYAAEETRPLP